MKLRKLLFLSLGHTTSDFYPGMLAPLLPLILTRYGLSLTAAGVLIGVLQAFCNLSQPFVGFLNDHRSLKLFLWMGLIVSAVPFCFMLQYKRLDVMIIALAISGIGVGMYHPVAAVAAGMNVEENRRGISMAVFSAGGSVGFMTAPVIIVVIVKILGEQFMPLVALPALIMAILFIKDRDIIVSEQHQLSAKEWIAALLENKFELTLLWLVSSLRALVHFLTAQFLPMLTIARGSSYVPSAFILSGSLLASMIGMFIGGHLSDIHGRRKIMAVSLLVSMPLLYGFLYTRGILSIAMLLLGMGSLASTIPVNIVLAQLAAPKHAGIASSLVMGLSFALPSFVAPFFGALADRIGIQGAMNALFIIPVFAGFIVFFLRKD